MNELLALDIAPQTELIPTIFSFILCVLMSFILRSFYLRRSFSLTGKNHIGSILPILSMVVFLVIIVVKSSLALSLGLVGALSIGRFRTPIKEPEESSIFIFSYCYWPWLRCWSSIYYNYYSPKHTFDYLLFPFE